MPDVREFSIWLISQAGHAGLAIVVMRSTLQAAGGSQAGLLGRIGYALAVSRGSKRLRRPRRLLRWYCG
jgi:hypothetical protein